MPDSFTPIVVLVGRQNVGKSTLFNRLTRSRQALVADYPGLTRDRHYGRARFHEYHFIVVDTGGFTEDPQDPFASPIHHQLDMALVEADLIYFMVDGRAGIQPEDLELAHLLRRCHAPIYVLANKTEGLDSAIATADFFQLGFGEPCSISASHGDYVHALLDETLTPFYAPPCSEEDAQKSITNSADDPNNPDADASQKARFEARIAVVGRPNVGKSTLINALIGHQQLIVSAIAGTTRDSIEVPFIINDQPYTLTDTAGMRKRSKVDDLAEKLSVIKTLASIEKAQVVVLVLDASTALTMREAHLAHYILEAGRAIVIAFNKWDIVGRGTARKTYQEDFSRRYGFLSFATSVPISAKKEQGLKRLLQAITRTYQSALTKMPTTTLNHILRQAVTQHPPPYVGRFRPKMRYAHQGGKNPPIVIIHGNSLNKISHDYQRYLEKCFIKGFALEGTPVHIKFKSAENPYQK